jgi:hypothetical protein
MAFDPKALKEGIEKCKVNITTFEEAIEGERNTIKEYRVMIDAIEEQERVKAKATIN